VRRIRLSPSQVGLGTEVAIKAVLCVPSGESRFAHTENLAGSDYALCALRLAASAIYFTSGVRRFTFDVSRFTFINPLYPP
jgi:hypothetical protein